MAHQDSGNGDDDFPWNEYDGDGGGCDGDLNDLINCDFWLEEDMEPPNNQISTWQQNPQLQPEPEPESEPQPQPQPEPASKEQEDNLGATLSQLSRLGPLDLKLTISSYFLNSLSITKQISKSQEKNRHSRKKTRHHQTVVMAPQPRQDDYYLSQTSERAKMKAEKFPILTLKIGTWQRTSIHQDDLVAKCYYAKKKLVWEVLEGGLKKKIEIQWSDISAIRAKIKEDGSGFLKIKLSQPPAFYEEQVSEPKKHTVWTPTQDFTGGQALRRHCLVFLPGVLDKPYEKLLRCDSRLFHLSQQPFHRESSRDRQYAPQQNPNIYNFKPEMRSSFNMDAQQLQVQPYHHHPHQQIINPSPFNLGAPYSETVARYQFPGGISNIAPTGFINQNNDYDNNNVDTNMFHTGFESNYLLADWSNQQQFYGDNAAPSVDALTNLYNGGNPAFDIAATNQPLCYEHNTAAAAAMFNVNQYSACGAELVAYPPHPNSWAAPPVSMATPPQNMVQRVSAAALTQNMSMAAQAVSHVVAPPQNMAQGVSAAALPQNMAPSMAAQAVSHVVAPPQNWSQFLPQPVSMVARPHNIEEDIALNLLMSNPFDQTIDHTMNGNNVANNNWPDVMNGNNVANNNWLF